MTAQTYTHQSEFFFAILDSIEQEIAVIRKDGAIMFVNDAWVGFGNENGMSKEDWLRSNYLDACTTALKVGEPGVQEIYEGIHAVVQGNSAVFKHEYPCHSPTEKRWFMMTIMALTGYENALFVITHINITLRKLAEEKVELLARHDPLTGLANRRHFDNHLNTEWHRSRREGLHLSAIMIDIDHFKAINDKHGHAIGDLCLNAVASVISQFARRATDLPVRWGGEEFILVLADTPLASALAVAEQIRLAVAQLQSPDFGGCTISAGVAAVIPDGDAYDIVIKQADKALYRAKETGRNRVVSFPDACG